MFEAEITPDSFKRCFIENVIWLKKTIVVHYKEIWIHFEVMHDFILIRFLNKRFFLLHEFLKIFSNDSWFPRLSCPCWQWTCATSLHWQVLKRSYKPISSQYFIVEITFNKLRKLYETYSSFISLIAKHSCEANQLWISILEIFYMQYYSIFQL